MCVCVCVLFKGVTVKHLITSYSVRLKSKSVCVCVCEQYLATVSECVCVSYM